MANCGSVLILAVFVFGQLPGGPFVDAYGDNTVEVKSKGKLIFAHVIFRHGDRTPIDPYPNDPWRNISNWPVDWGQLTNLGKQQHYALGQWLRKRYKTLLNEEYSPKLVYVQSTDVDRTLMSALSNIAGLFPPAADQEWNPNLNWQPIPIHTTPEYMDNILAMKKHCAAYEFALKKYRNSDEMIQLNKKFQPLYEYLTEMTGKKIDSFTGVQMLYNNLYIEDINNKTLPNWTKKVYYPGSDMQWIANRSFAIKTDTPQLARLKTGFLIKDIFTRFKNKSQSLLKPDRSMWIYSAHDTTIANILNSLLMFEYHSPPYTACIMFELRVHKEIPMVQIYYKNSTEEPQLMYIPDCGTSCPLDKMFEFYGDILPGNFDEECKLSMLSMTYAEVDLGSITGPLIAGIVFLSIALSIFVALHLYQRRSYPNSKWYMRIDS